MTFAWIVVCSIAAAALATSASANAQQRRPMTPGDIERLRPIWTSSISPDGRYIAIVVGRTPSIRSQYHGRSDAPLLQRDVWVVPTAGGAAVNVTDGDRDASTSWSLAWSPNGKRLAALTTKGSRDRIRVVVWTADAADSRAYEQEPAHEPTVVVPRSAVYYLTAGRRSDQAETTPVVWLTDDDFLYVTVDDGDDASTIDIAAAAWQTTRLGLEASSSVLESGAAVTPRPRRWSRLERVHVPSRTVTLLATVPPEYQRQTTLSLIVSPSGKHVAVVGDIGPNLVPPTVTMSRDNERRTRIGIVPLDGSAAADSLLKWAPRVAGPQAASVRWSPDGARVAVLAKPLAAGDSIRDPGTPSNTVFIATIDGAVRTIARDTLRATAVEWTSADQLIVRAREEHPGTAERGMADAGSEAGGTRARDEWWRVERISGRRTATTDSLASVPSAVIRLGDGRFVGLNDSTGIVIGPTGHARTIDVANAPALRAIVWPRNGGPATDNVIVAEGGGPSRADTRWYQVRIADDRARALEIERPAPAPRFVGFHAAAGDAAVAAFSGATDSGTFVWVTRGGQSVRAVFANNRFIAEVETGPRRLISYRHVDGDSLSAELLLPPGYRNDTRVPVLVWVYGGASVSDTLFMEGKHVASLFNPQLFAAKGVAVLFPSIPLAPYGTNSAEPIADIAKSVMPAVDRLVDLGIADPERIAVGGLSYGAYAVYGLLTQTSRFRAAIAIDGDADLFTSYVAFDASTRYLDGAHERREGFWWAEASQGRMGATPWQDPLRYVRNSPFFALDRITTPLLIVHCDLDFVPIAHAEQMFAGLYRLGKTARFVRYFGEKHGPFSPANLQDVWAHIYRWIDEYLDPQTAARETP